MPTDRRLLFRLGINLGEIITEGEDIYGTGVNVAARLESLALPSEPGGICVSASVHEQIQSLQGLGFEDLGEQLVKNMSRPVRSFALRTQSSDPIAYQRLSRSYSHEADAEGGAHRRMASIAVLPFTNLSGDPEQEYFADGIAEDIITSLSKISNLLVISRNSTFAYKGKAVDAHVVGRELNVRYVLEGSVRKAGGRVRISAQLVEAIGRQQLWAVRFDRELSDIFALQDEITSNVVAALQLKLVEGEQARVWHRGTKSFEAWECLMQGLQLFRHFTKDDNAKARVLFWRALELDPNYAMGLVRLAWTYWSDGRFHWTTTPDDALTHADELARIQGREILRVAPKFDMALYAKSLTYQDPEDSRRSLDALAKAFAPAAVIRPAAAAA